jgi:exodeoxyribonuclease VII small subunit
MSDKKKRSDDISYAAASAELEQILQDIESGEIDLDVLTDKVERAAALLAICRQKLAATETKVKKVTAELATAAEQPDSADDEETRP